MKKLLKEIENQKQYHSPQKPRDREGIIVISSDKSESSNEHLDDREVSNLVMNNYCSQNLIESSQKDSFQENGKSKIKRRKPKSKVVNKISKVSWILIDYSSDWKENYKKEGY